MNATVYIFGNFSNGYAQYPVDYTEVVFQKFLQNATSESQIAVHRDSDLMYYGYVRKLNKNEAIGCCTVINGLLLTDFTKLYSVYERLVEQLAVNGDFIQIANNGELKASDIGCLANCQDQIDEISIQLRNEFDRLTPSFKGLPPQSFSTAKDSVRNYSITDNPDTIVKASYTESFTFIYKVAGSDTVKLSSYRGTLIELNREKNKLADELEDLKKKHNATLRQKKSITVVLGLLIFVVLLICCGSIFYKATKEEISQQQQQLSLANAKIANTELNLKQAEQEKLDLRNENYKLYIKVEKFKNEIAAQKQKIVEKEEEIEIKDNEIKKLKQQLLYPSYNSNGRNLSNSSSKRYNSNDNQSKDIFIKNPQYYTTSENKCTKIISVKVTYAQTIIELEYDNFWCRSGYIFIEPNTYIESYKTGKKYKMLKAEGIPIGPKKHVLTSSKEKVRFRLIFPALPKNTTKFKLIESEGSSWKFYGIEL